jgi:hypothetical protein
MSAGAPLPDFEFPYTRYAPGGQNGRVNFHAQPSASGATVPDSAGFQYPTQTEVSFAGDALRGNLEHNPVAEAFFTRSNMDIIQETLRKEVRRMSGPKNYQIDRQSVDEIKTIMRAMYLQYSKNSPFNVAGQVQELNKMVVEWSAPRILSEIEAYQYYLKDISTLPVPMEQPVSMSSAGTRSLPFKVPM